MKKILFYLSFMVMLFSCNARVARAQFERGEYRESVRTTISFVSNGKFADLKLEEKNEVISRLRHIDNYYQNILNGSDDINNIKNLYDAFAIANMIKSFPELNYYVNLNILASIENIAYRLENSISQKLNAYTSDRDLNVIKNIQADMRKLSLSSSHYNMYRNISRSLADKYYEKAMYSRNLEEQIKYLELTYKTYEDFDADYKGSRSKRNKLSKEIDIKKAKEYVSEGKTNLFFEEYDKAIEKFEKAIKLYSKYSDYSFEQRELEEYIYNTKSKQRLNHADKYIKRAYEYIAMGQYEKAVENFYKASEIEYNYKNSLLLAKEYESKIPRRSYKKVRVSSNGRGNLIERILISEGFEPVTYNENINLKYFEEVYYENGEGLNGPIETIRIVPTITIGNRTVALDEIILRNELRPIGKDEMLKINDRVINESLEQGLRRILRSLVF